MQCPPEQWLNFNVDAACDEGIACVAVVARNSTGEGLKTRLENTILYSAAAMALAVRWVLELVLNMGCKQGLIEGDAKLVIERILINNKKNEQKGCQFVQERWVRYYASPDGLLRIYASSS